MLEFVCWPRTATSRRLLYLAGFIAVQVATPAAYAAAPASHVSDTVGFRSGPYVAAHVGISMAAKQSSSVYESRSSSKSSGNWLRAAPVASIASGYVFNNKLRADVSFTYRGNYVYKPLGNDGGIVKYRQNVKSASMMVNGYLSLVGLFNKRLGAFDPYVMGGLGWAANMAGDVIGSDGSNQRGQVKQNFAWQVGAGTACKVSQRFYLDLGYKYAVLGQVKTSDLASDSTTAINRLSALKKAWTGKLNAHEIVLGVIYKF